MNKNYPDPGKLRINLASSTGFTGISQNISDQARDGFVHDEEDFVE